MATVAKRKQVSDKDFLVALKQIVANDQGYAELSVATGLKESTVKQRAAKMRKLFAEKYSKVLPLPKSATRATRDEDLSDFLSEFENLPETPTEG